MRALAAYLTVILCCGFYKDKQLPAYLSLKSSSISAFCKIFSAKNPYPITARTEKRQNKADRKRFFRMRFPAAGTLRQRPDSLFRPLRFGRSRDSYRARASTRKCVPLPRNSSACPCLPPNIGEGILRGSGGYGPIPPVRCFAPMYVIQRAMPDACGLNPVVRWLWTGQTDPAK